MNSDLRHDGQLHSHWRAAVVDDDPSWRLAAACRGMDPAQFFPERGEPTQEAKTACEGCPVREPCLEFALRNKEKWGLWGGLYVREREWLRRRRRSVA